MEPCAHCEVAIKHVMLIMDERDRRYMSMFDELDKALKLAREDTMHWRANANEWRSAMTDREQQFLSRSMGVVIGLLSIASMSAALFVLLHDRL